MIQVLLDKKISEYLIMKILAFVFLWFFTFSVFASENIFSSITLDLGYSQANTETSEFNGGVSSLVEAEQDGRIMGFNLVLEKKFFENTSPYFDFSTLIQGDRDFYIPSVGLRHEFESEDANWVPYVMGGIGYVYANWSEPPVDNVIDGQDSGESLALSLRGGVNIFITDNLAFDLGLRLDGYDISTDIVQNSRVTTITDKSSLSLLAGLTYRFSKKPKIDSDRDKVPDIRDECPNTISGAPVDAKGCVLDSDKDDVIDFYDRCPGTLPNAPVDASGCIPEKFEFNLQLGFDRFEIVDLKQRPQFKVVDFLNKHADYHVRITGHTDSSGSKQYNQKLSERRAGAARVFLILKGISRNRVHAYGRGETEPVNDNITQQDRDENRRIHIEFYRVAGE